MAVYDYFLDVASMSLRLEVVNCPAPRGILLVFPDEAGRNDYRFVERCAKSSLCVVTVDYRGTGKSSGEASLEANISDANAVVENIDRIIQVSRPIPIFVLGRSSGLVCATSLYRRLPRFASGFVFENPNGLETTETAKSSSCLVIDNLDDSDELNWSRFVEFVEEMLRRSDRRAGCLIAQGLGDALGFLVEGHAPAICKFFVQDTFSRTEVPVRCRGEFSFGQYSDDTQLARELAQSLTHNPAWNPQDFAERVGRLFEEDLIVGRGQATQNAAYRILNGIAWNQAGEPSPSAGNGAAMRVAPIGLAYTEANERLRIADEQARVTHLDPRSRAAAILVADVVADALADQARPHSPEWYEHLAARVFELDPTLSECLRQMPRWLSLPIEQADAQIAKSGNVPSGSAHRFEEWHGISPFATPSALYALYAFAKTPDSVEEVLKTAVAVGGDVDTVAAMAGAMVGAKVGLSGFGKRMLEWAGYLNDQKSFGAAQLVRLAYGLG